MRIELHAALWILAVLALGITVLHRPSVRIPIIENAPPPVVTSADVPLSPIDGEGDASVPVRAANGRPLFRIAEVDLNAPPEFAAIAFAEPVVSSLTLKGIVDTDAGPRAVFEGLEGEPAYVIVGVEEEIGALRVTNISSDTVSAQGNDGDVVHFKLRGSGESLE